MKRLFDLISAEERQHIEKSLDLSTAATEQVQRKTRAAREFLAGSCYFSEEIEPRWAQASPEVRRRVLSELIWRSTCILDKSSTAVMGLNRFNLGYNFKLVDTTLEGKQVLIITGEDSA